MASLLTRELLAPACKICRDPLGRVACPRCAGSGVVRHRLLLRRECPTCHGVRWWFRCAHANEHFRLAMQRD